MTAKHRDRLTEGQRDAEREMDIFPLNVSTPALSSLDNCPIRTLTLPVLERPLAPTQHRMHMRKNAISVFNVALIASTTKLGAAINLHHRSGCKLAAPIQVLN